MAESKTEAAPAAQEAPKTVKIDLRNPITIANALGVQKFPAGQDIEVPEGMANDLKRIDREHEDYKANLMIKRTSTVDSGSFAVGGAS